MVGLVLLSSGAIGASAIIRVDEVVSVEGILTPTSGSIEVKSPAGGLVDEVLPVMAIQLKRTTCC